MPVFRDVNKLQKHIKKALDATLSETLITAQRELGSTDISPRDTGRFRSSWFAAEGGPSSAVAPEGADSPNTDAKGLRVDSEKTYHLTNSLEYAQSVAIEGKVVTASPGWFHSFRNQRLRQIQQEAAETAKKAFDL